MKARQAEGVKTRAIASEFPKGRTLADFMITYDLRLVRDGGQVVGITWLESGSIGIEFDSVENCSAWVMKHSG